MSQYKNIGTTQTSIADTTWFPSQEAAGGASSTRKNAWSLIKSTLKTYFDTLYATVAGTVTTKAVDYQILDDDGFGLIYLSGAGANKTFTLPTLAANINRKIRLYNIDSTYELNVDGEGAETIEGMTDIDLPVSGNYIEVIGQAAEWKISSENITCSWRADTHAGYGGGSYTVIPYFTNVRQDLGNLLTINNNSTEGLTMTPKKAGRYNVSSSVFCDGSAQHIGFSLDTSQGTTGIQSINIQDRLAIDRQVATVGANIAWGGRLEVGEDLRLHNSGAFTPTSSISHLTITYMGA